MVGHWIEASKSWVTELNQNCKRVGSDRAVFYPEAEKKLYEWIIKQRKMGLEVIYAIVRVKMIEILKGPEMIHLYGNSVECFKTSNRWMFAFMKRFNLFRAEKSFKLSNILNMDKTPVWFDMAGNFTIDQTGERTIHIRRTGNEKNRFTVVLTCAADGTKFLPICIFKGKKLPRNERDLIPSGVIVWFQQNGWMDSNLMMDYVDYINESRTDNLAVIPDGLTSVCQPLDVAINKPFKDNLRKEWHLWMVNDDAGETSADEVIIQSFKTCKISNSLNELIKYKFEMESDKENEEELEIDMHDSQVSYEEITLEDDPFFEIELNFTIYNDNEFVYSDESSLNDDN
ncbi:hypothetical protein RclHR1_18130002 [Rhizophagus clarus]|uniref:HTH CENPB-type domain-containing protein n=1 Tax=Rhizophagus clarus TaxID=94130 RepID=A0A2Z6REX9_9GLOM|nr:hypothetical protein RclHR1_18130002 [Rhizophagus clarus]